MHAIRQHAFGGPDVLVYEDVPDLEPGDGQVRIAVEAAGVHLLDTTIRAGTSGGPFPLPDLPMTPGREVAGRVDRVGPGVQDAWIGLRVVAHLGMASGGYAEQAVTPVGALHEIAGEVGPAAAVAMIGTGRTALGVLDVADLTPDDVVLVTGAAGGLGSLLVQAAHAAGAMAVGVAGGEAKVAHVRRVGADVAVAYLRDDWPDRVRAELGDRSVTVLLDGVGGAAGRAALELVAVGGRVVLFGYSSGSPLEISSGDLFARGLTVGAAVGPRIMQRPGGLRELETAALAAVTAGDLTPTVDATFALADAGAAHRALEARATTGKVVLLP